MSHQMRVILRSLADDMALAASPAFVSSLPVGNLQTQQRAEVARSADTSNQAITGDLTAARLLGADGFALIGRFSEDATVRVRLYAEAAQGGDVVYDSGPISVLVPIPWGEFAWGEEAWGGVRSFQNGAEPFFFRFFDDADDVFASYLSWQIDISDATNPDGYHQFRRLVWGRGVSPTINVDWGYQWELVDESKMFRDEAGGLHTETRAKYRRIRATLSHMTQSERVQWADGLRYCGKSRDVFAVLKPYESGGERMDLAFLARFTKLPNFKQSRPNQYAAGFVLEET